MTDSGSENSQYWWWLALAAATGVLIWLLAPILAPFLTAAILAYICNPLVDRMSRKMPRTVAATLVLAMLVALFVTLLLILLPLLVKQVKAIVQQFPLYIDWVKTHLAPWIERYFNTQVDISMIKDWLTDHAGKIQELAAQLLPTLKSGGLALLEFFANLLLIPLVLFYFMRDWNLLIAHTAKLIPRRWNEVITDRMREIDAVLGEFLRGQLLVMLFMAVFYIIALWIVGLDYALSVGLIAGMLTFVPYLGVIIGVVLATLTGLLQFGDLTPLIWIWVVFVVANVIEGNVIVPWLVGDRIGLHPVAVIFALLAFGQLFGFTGVLLALPASAALLVWLRYARRKYLDSDVYQNQ